MTLSRLRVFEIRSPVRSVFMGLVIGVMDKKDDRVDAERLDNMGVFIVPHAMRVSKLTSMQCL